MQHPSLGSDQYSLEPFTRENSHHWLCVARNSSQETTKRDTHRVMLRRIYIPAPCVERVASLGTTKSDTLKNHTGDYMYHFNQISKGFSCRNQLTRHMEVMIGRFHTIVLCVSVDSNSATTWRNTWRVILGRMWQGIHLQEPHKETHKDSFCGESIRLYSVWKGIHLQKLSIETHEYSQGGEFILICYVWLGFHLHKPPKETHKDSCFG